MSIIASVSQKNLSGDLKAKAGALGFNMVGVVEARPARRLAAYFNWISQEMHGAMGYMARDDRIVRRKNPQTILPGVASIVCVGLEYATIPLPDHIAQDPSRGRISNYAWGVDYHELMEPRLEELAGWLREHDPDAQSRVYVDTGAILERDHAESAGLGFVGKNTMLIAPQRGSYFFLGELLTTLNLAADTRNQPMPGCGSCRRCLDVCPTDAFPEPYVLDARRCISYLTIELKGWVPHELRPLMGNWVYGCDLCQTVCPFNRFALPAAEKRFYPIDWEAAAPPLLTLLDLDEAAFFKLYERSPIRRIKRERLVRNACVAAGNWGDADAVPPLIKLLGDDSPIVRGHAAWALQQIGGASAEGALKRSRHVETDPRVLKELAAGS